MTILPEGAESPPEQTLVYEMATVESA